MNKDDFIQIRQSQINYYHKVPLYCKTDEAKYRLYKPRDVSLSEMRIHTGRHPLLFIDRKDRVDAIKESQKGFNILLKKNMESGNVNEIKSTLCDLVEETLSEPRSGTLRALPETVDILITGYSKQPDIFKIMANIAFTDYTTVIHSINVMALTMGFCFHNDFSVKETKKFGLCALLHDVGKTQIPEELLTAPRKLTDEEFSLIKAHTTIGYKIITQKNKIDNFIALGSLEHHEKLDGSGYPRGISDISFVGRLLNIIDCYEALTNEDRPYRRAKEPLATLELLKGDVEDGKLDKEIFEKFCYSLI